MEHVVLGAYPRNLLVEKEVLHDKDVDLRGLARLPILDLKSIEPKDLCQHRRGFVCLLHVVKVLWRKLEQLILFCNVPVRHHLLHYKPIIYMKKASMGYREKSINVG